MGTQMNRLVETVLLSTHNICFACEIRKLFFDYTLLSRGQDIKSGNNSKKSGTKFEHRCGEKGLVAFVALSPKSTAMVIAGRSVHLTTLFPGQA